MSHQVLARKWRPQTFNDIVGQEHVVTALVNALTANRLHHAYLFSGTRGVGKTTVARVLAKALTCEQGITPEPCGQCGACQAIAEGRFVDLIEVDAASRTRVEDTRELLDNVQYAPTRGRFKIYLIDEVHMLSGHSFNALLKTLEEPPEHVKFLLATTDPQKLPVTVLSRCLQFTLRHISTEQISRQLAKILKSESIHSEPGALLQLSESADGSMRDALTLLDQAIAFSGGEVTEKTVSQMLGTVPSEQVDALVNAVCEFDPERAMSVVHSLTALNVDFGKLLDQLIMIFHAAAISQAVPQYKQQVTLFADTVTKVCEAVSAEDIQLFYQIVLNARKDLYLAHSPRAGFEMTILRMIMFRPGEQSRKVHAKRVSSSEQAGKSVESDTKYVSSNTNHRIISEHDSVPAIDNAKPDAGPDTSSFKTTDSINEIVEQKSVSEVNSEICADDSSSADTVDQWLGMINKANISGVVKALATHCALQCFSDNRISLLLANEHESLMAGATVTKLTQKLQETFGSDTDVTIEVTDKIINSPAQQTRDRDAQRLNNAQASLDQDDFIQALKRDLQAEIVPGSIQSKQEGES